METLETLTKVKKNILYRIRAYREDLFLSLYGPGKK